MKCWILITDEGYTVYNHKQNAIAEFESIKRNQYPGIPAIKGSKENDCIVYDKKNMSICEWRGWSDGWVDLVKVVEGKFA